MIKVRDINVKIAQLKEKIERKTMHSYLEKHIPASKIDEDKLLLFYLMMEQLQWSEEKLDSYLVTIMLVHIALDTHETVTIENANGQIMKKRQLTVLAGDYFSGLYYYILAGMDDIPMITALAAGIKEVNEHKIKLYQKEIDQIDLLLNTLKTIESSIFCKIADFFGKSYWNEIASNILLFKRLIHERENFTQNGNSIVFDILKNLVLQKNKLSECKRDTEQEKYILYVWDCYIEHTRAMIEKLLKTSQFMNSTFQKHIHALLFNNISTVNKLVEEG